MQFQNRLKRKMPMVVGYCVIALGSLFEGKSLGAEYRSMSGSGIQSLPAVDDSARQERTRDNLYGFSILIAGEQKRIDDDRSAGRASDPPIPLARDIGISKSEEHLIRIVVIDLFTKMEEIRLRRRGPTQARDAEERRAEVDVFLNERRTICDRALNQLQSQLGDNDFKKFTGFLAQLNPELKTSHGPNSSGSPHVPTATAQKGVSPQ